MSLVLEMLDFDGKCLLILYGGLEVMFGSWASWIGSSVMCSTAPYVIIIACSVSSFPLGSKLQWVRECVLFKAVSSTNTIIGAW